METLDVALGDRSYPIYIGAGCLDHADLVQKHVVGQQVMIVSMKPLRRFIWKKPRLCSLVMNLVG